MINYNLVGGALVHCTKIAECTLLLVDEDYKERALDNEELRSLGISMHVVDREFRQSVSSIPFKIPDPDFTKDVNEKTRVAIRYTRQASPSSIIGSRADVGKRYNRTSERRDGDNWPILLTSGGSVYADGHQTTS